MRVPDLERAFVDGATYPIKGIDGLDRLATCEVRVVAAGELCLPSGRLIAADPALVYGDAEPFSRAVPRGAFPVTLSVAHVAHPAGDGTRAVEERVNAAMIRFADDRPVRWELAVLDGEDAASLGEREVFGYPVESGFGCFIDADSLGAYTDLGDEPVDEFELLLEALPDSVERTCTWAGLPLAAEGVEHAVTFGDAGVGAGADRLGTGTFRLVAFSAGWYGDVVSGAAAVEAGTAEIIVPEAAVDEPPVVCPTWFGLDADDRPVRAVTDFGVLPAWQDTASEASTGTR
jgi:hypothetical protein